MDKKLTTTIATVAAVVLVGVGIFFGVTSAKKGEKCRYCGKYYPHGEIMGHQIRCDKNKESMSFRK